MWPIHLVRRLTVLWSWQNKYPQEVRAGVIVDLNAQAKRNKSNCAS